MEKNDMVIENNVLIEIAMKMILHAGNARNLIYEAGNFVKIFQFEDAKRLMEEAGKELNLAHVAQTGYIQKEASGEKMEYSILFTHAQDTLMTIVSEHNMMKQMLDIVMCLYDAMKGNGGKMNE